VALAQMQSPCSTIPIFYLPAWAAITHHGQGLINVTKRKAERYAISNLPYQRQRSGHVTPDPQKPFRVGADQVTVTVLGTGFDVSEGNAVSMVGVEHGRVQVENAANVPAVFEILEAGQNVRVGQDGTVTRHPSPTSQIGAWRKNQLIAQDQPLSEVVDQLRRYFNGTILITDEVLAAQTVTGVYRLDDPVSALRGMARAQKATVREITPWVLVVSKS